jgi:hypothetical protein
VQKPGPPVILGVHGPKALERVARSVQITPLVDPLENGPSSGELTAYREAGADRLILLSQETVAATADGKALELIKHFSQVAERNCAL